MRADGVLAFVKIILFYFSGECKGFLLRAAKGDVLWLLVVHDQRIVIHRIVARSAAVAVERYAACDAEVTNGNGRACDV